MYIIKNKNYKISNDFRISSIPSYLKNTNIIIKMYTCILARKEIKSKEQSFKGDIAL